MTTELITDRLRLRPFEPRDRDAFVAMNADPEVMRFFVPTQSVHGQGYATEGARAVVDHAFQVHKRTEIVAFTATSNASSRRVMEKLGMVHVPELTFDHPMVPTGHPHREHVLYRLVNTARAAAKG